jgi:hypothetical protein
VNANASKINGGLDIINTFCEHYKLPQLDFIDNRESIIQVIDIQSQLINLMVSKTIKIESGVIAIDT